MLTATIDMIERTASAFDVTPVVVKQIVWGGLLAGFVFATIHLVTMLVTRWGDGDPTSKALIFSVLIHLSCAFGVVVVSPPDPVDMNSADEQRMQIVAKLAEGEEQVERDRPGDTPVWDRLPDAPDQDISRTERLPSELTPLALADRQPELQTPPDIDTPDFTQLPDEPRDQPTPVELADSGLRTPASIPINLDDPQATARPEVSPPTVATERQPVERSGIQEEAVQRKPSQGAVDRVQPEIERTRQLAVSLTPDDPTTFLNRGSDERIVRRRSGPAPSPEMAEEPGAVTTPSQTETVPGGDPAPRFNRLQTRTVKRQDDDNGTQRRSTTTPRLEDAKSDRAVAMREGVLSKLPTAGAVPNVVRPNFDSVRRKDEAGIPSTYRLRNLDSRRDVAQKFGGTEASENAVEASLKWLARNQAADGHWDAAHHGAGTVKFDSDGVDRMNAGLHADSGITGLAVLAFLGAGHTQEQGDYTEQVGRALDWLVRQQRDDGFLGGKASRYAMMYCHGMATIALAEAYGMQSKTAADTRLRQPLRQAVGYIIANQNPQDGGWRYIKGQRGDMSMFGWQLMALKSAESAGLPISSEVRNGMIQFLRERSLGRNNGLAAYRLTEPAMPPTPSMTAESLFCKQLLGIKRTNSASLEAVEYLSQHLPRRSAQNLYYWYYGTLAMYHHGGDAWDRWNDALRDTLVADQRKTGSDAGSWDPRPPWGPYGGRVFSTALSTLCLESYYRYLPLNQATND